MDVLFSIPEFGAGLLLICAMEATGYCGTLGPSTDGIGARSMRPLLRGCVGESEATFRKVGGE
jgi:hypothetical protein